MANETVLNPNIENSNATVLNPSVAAGNATILNTDIVSSVEIQKGTVLCDDYTVNGKLDIPTGEADLYLCTKKRQTYVAKVYRRKSAIKDEIIKKLLSINSPYVAKIYASGSFNGFPVEILPYYKNGSLKGEKFTLEELKEEVIPSLNEGLHALHEVGIIHKDLKPSNIMLSDDGQSVAIIDFGISSVRENDATVVVTRTGMTPEYSAPETFRNAFLEESDYYSLGITIFELYYGKTPYDNMDKEKIAQYVAVQKIPLPDDMPQDLKDLVNGLTYPDITNRKDKSNPNRRWGYEQVKAWCEGKAQELPGSNNVVAFNAEAMKPYPFMGKAYTNRSEFVEALATNWNDGKKQLFRGLISGFFKGFDPETAGHCIDAEEAVEKDRTLENITFFKALYKIDSSNTKLMWKGRIYNKVSDFGEELLNELWAGRDDQYFDDALQNGVLSTYEEIRNPNDKKAREALASAEKYYRLYSNSTRDKMVQKFVVAYLLSGHKVFKFDGREFGTVDELTLYLSNTLDKNYESFEKLCFELLGEDKKLMPQFEAWLIALGKGNEVKKWYETLA